MSLQILPYRKGSKSAKLLRQELGMMKQRELERALMELSEDTVSKYTLINWGAGTIPAYYKLNAKRVLNPVRAVNIASDKLRFFTTASEKEVRVPMFTSDLETAMSWVNDGLTVLGRKKRGSCAQDIVFYEESPAEFLESDFWVQYKKKKYEFRVHVFLGEVISLQQKALRTHDLDGNPIDTSLVNHRIRNHRNGFIFKRNDIEVPDDAIEQAKAAVKACKLDFGAVDVIYNKHEGKAYVLEVNTAPGLEGTTLNDYVAAFKALSTES